MKFLMIPMAAAAVVAMASVPGVASASVVSISDPGGSGVIGARIRWGGTGWEAAIRSSTYCPAPSPNVCAGTTLNPPGTPAWVVGAYAFRVEYTTDGTLSLGVDFGGQIGLLSTSYNFGALSGLGFEYLQISGNESGGSTRRSNVSNLMINGTGFGTLTPDGTLLDTFYDDTSGGATAWLITGTFNYTQAGTGNDERPSWNFAFRAPGAPDATPVSAPGTLALGGLALLALSAVRRRKAA